MGHRLQVVHIIPLHSHHWLLSICRTLAPRLVFEHRRNLCQLFVARRWQFASCWQLLQIICQQSAS